MRVVPYYVNVTDVNVTKSCVHVVSYDVSVTDVNITAICLKSVE